MRAYPHNATFVAELSTDPERRVEQTVGAMLEMVRRAHRMVYVPRLALGIGAAALRSMEHHTAPWPRVVAWHAHDLARRRLRFAPDPPGVEMPRHPDQLAESIIGQPGVKVLGDCDCVATLIASILALLDTRPCFVVSGPEGAPYSHVYAAIDEASGYWPIDPQEVNTPGTEVPAARRRVFRLE